MQPIKPSTVLENLTWRYAVKKFDSTRKIPADQWAALEQAVILAPSSFGLQPWKFVVVSDPALRQKLRPVSWNQSQITDASHLVVFAHRTGMTAADVDRFIDRIVQVRGVPAAAVEDYRQMMLGFVKNPAPGFDLGTWAAKQVYIALGVFLSSAAMMGIDACPMEGFDHQKYDEILGLPAQGYSVSVVATAGYRAADDAYANYAKVRFSAEEVILRRGN